MKNDQSVSIIYQDNGGGIPEDIIDKIFDFNVSTKKEQGGTGIGLYMVKMIVDKYNGKVDVKNTDHGSCFRLSF